MIYIAALALLLAPAIAPAPAPPPAPAPAPAEIVAAAPPAAWRQIPPDELLLIDLANGRRVTIELAPSFAPVHVANIRALARAHWWDGTSVNRVQDGYVVQWGDASEKKPLPPGLARPAPPEYDRPLAGMAIKLLPYRDAFARQVGFADGWPVASDGRSAWLTHCYAMVGVGRDMPPDTGSGAELYAVIGPPARPLDRNIALIGRVIDGFDALTALPRGHAEMGFYQSAAERTTIASARLASDLPPDKRANWQEMRTDATAFADYVAARANRGTGFFVRAAGAIDLCGVNVPTRKFPGN